MANTVVSSRDSMWLAINPNVIIQSKLISPGSDRIAFGNKIGNLWLLKIFTDNIFWLKNKTKSRIRIEINDRSLPPRRCVRIEVFFRQRIIIIIIIDLII